MIGYSLAPRSHRVGACKADTQGGPMAIGCAGVCRRGMGGGNAGVRRLFVPAYFYFCPE